MKISGRTIIVIMFAGAMILAVSFSYGGIAATYQQNPPITSPEGEALYKQKCAVCHDNPQDRVPPLFLIRRRSAEDVIQTLTTGSMKQQAAGLTANQIRAIAIHLTGKEPVLAAQDDLDANHCSDHGGPININGPQWNGWGRDLD